ncbi:response regulator [Myxococcota bacterium]|nr:response regulator [Myxococcota bacterium]MBU1430400.1 response regulator [Myxococcota bacterium]MBU1897368.1 response regulator [Myxococcota bacterium]
MAEADKKKILLIEDEKHVQTMVSRFLIKNGYEVEIAVDGLRALRSIDERHPDLIISDVLMPNVDGLSLLKALRGHPETRNIPVIFLTAKSDPLSMIEGINAGAKFYITKPFKIEDVLVKIQKVLGK